MPHAERVAAAVSAAVILVTGSGTSGSWQIRGEQLGAAIGATVLPRCADFAGVDLVIVVKRVLHETLRALRKAGTPWIWDVVDAWPQPGGNEWGQDQAVGWLRSEIWRVNPSAMVFPTSAMRADSGFSGPSLVLPHHAWPKYRPAQIRRAVVSVGYEGSEHYLGKWGGAVAAQCASGGWRFELNKDLQEADIGVALRDCSGYPAAAWKANTKLANLQALGIPAICSPETGYREFGSGAEIYPDSPDDLPAIFDRLADADARQDIGAAMLKAAPRLERVAADYLAWLRSSF